MVEGKAVRLEYDWQSKDKYGRTLAYVYLTDGTFLNAEIIKQGYGHAYTRFPFKYLERFKQYEKAARQAKMGLWGDPPTEKDKKLILEKYVGSKDSKIYHHPTCIAAQNIKPSNRRVFYSVKKAVDAGYVPCKICRPPYSK
jgi:micrococcal nuclease